jgi:hypothetical protein
MHLIANGDGPSNSWTLSSHMVTSSGHAASPAQLAAFVHQYCATVAAPGPSTGGPPSPQPGGVGADAGRACLDQAARTFHLLVTYQPVTRYWTFQWLETGMFLALALICAASCFYWVTRRAV